MFDFLSFLDKTDPQFHTAEANLDCSKCKENRVMLVSLWKYESPYKQLTRMPFEVDHPEQKLILKTKYHDGFIPSMWICTCRQCETKHLLIILPKHDKYQWLLLSENQNGVSTIHTPEPVRYYLNQAFAAKMIGANSACIAMYRAALEQLLYDQGYHRGMLNQKIQDLRNDKSSGIGSTWLKNVDDDLLEYLKDLGNGAIHPNNGDISKQQAFDDKLISTIDEVFEEFLNIIYENTLRSDRIKNLQLSRATSVSS